MKRELPGFERGAVRLDFDLYRAEVPIAGVGDGHLSVVDLWPEGVERAILFVHGYACVAETWEYQLNHFANGYRVVAPDLRGHGQSDAPDREYTMPELVADLLRVAEALKLPERFVLAGHSFGGQQAKAFVVPRPGSNLSAEELIELCRKRLEPYAVPWEIEFRDELPKSFVGKVLRRMLVEESA